MDLSIKWSFTIPALLLLAACRTHTAQEVPDAGQSLVHARPDLFKKNADRTIACGLGGLKPGINIILQRATTVASLEGTIARKLASMPSDILLYWKGSDQTHDNILIVETAQHLYPINETKNGIFLPELDSDVIKLESIQERDSRRPILHYVRLHPDKGITRASIIGRMRAQIKQKQQE